MEIQHFTPRMDDYEQVELLPMAARDISEALVDVEIEIRRTASSGDCINACLVLRTFTERLLALEKLALDRAEALNHLSYMKES